MRVWLPVPMALVLGAPTALAQAVDGILLGRRSERVCQAFRV